MNFLNRQQTREMPGFLISYWGFPRTSSNKPPYSEFVLQWLKGDTFEDGGTTYMTDYSGNDYHAIVVDSDTIIQQVNTPLYNADTTQAFWYTDASTPNNIDLADLSYDVYDDVVSHHITFADVSESSFKNIVTYSTPLTISQLNTMYSFVDDQVVRDESGQALKDELGNIIYKAQYVPPSEGSLLLLEDGSSLLLEDGSNLLLE